MGFISLLGQLNLLHLPDLEKRRQNIEVVSDSVLTHHPQDSLTIHISK